MEKPTFALCPPDHFDVSYVINPWMKPDEWAANRGGNLAAAAHGWAALAAALGAAGAEVMVMPAKPGVPDLVFMANAAVVLDRKVLLAHFRHPERRAEEPFITAFFENLKAKGVVASVDPCPPGLIFEGAGDAVWDPARAFLWMGHGQRSSVAMAGVLEDFYRVTVQPLRLIDPRFYHLDTAFCPLSGGDVIYFPAAFAPASQALIAEIVPGEQRLIIGEADATMLAANAVCIGRTIITGAMGKKLQDRLGERGYRVVTTPIESFAKSGGAAYCLTLRLDRRTTPAASRDRDKNRPLAVEA